MNSSVSRIVMKKKTERMSETLGGLCVKYFLTEKRNREDISDTRRSVSAADLPFGGEKN